MTFKANWEKSETSVDLHADIVAALFDTFS